MKNSIRISEKHGVNPSIACCFFCGKEKNEIIFFGRLKDDQEAPRGAVINREPCDECAELMTRGVMLIQCTGDEKRTGKIVVLKVELIGRIIHDDLAKHILNVRFAFVPIETWNAIGLIQ